MKYGNVQVSTGSKSGPRPLEIVIERIVVPYQRMTVLGQVGEVLFRDGPISARATVMLPSGDNGQTEIKLTSDEESEFADLMRRVSMRYLAETRDAMAGALNRATE